MQSHEEKETSEKPEKYKPKESYEAPNYFMVGSLVKLISLNNRVSKIDEISVFTAKTYYQEKLLNHTQTHRIYKITINT